LQKGKRAEKRSLQAGIHSLLNSIPGQGKRNGINKICPQENASPLCGKLRTSIATAKPRFIPFSLSTHS
jgi:hypothetical protein